MSQRDRYNNGDSRLLTALGINGQVIVDVIPEVELIIGKQPSVLEVGATEAQNRFNQRAIQLAGKESDPSVTLDQIAEA